MYMNGYDLPEEIFIFFNENAHNLTIQISDFYLFFHKCSASDKDIHILKKLGFTDEKESGGSQFVFNSDKGTIVSDELFINSPRVKDLDRYGSKPLCCKCDVNDDNLVKEDFDLLDKNNYSTEFDFFTDTMHYKAYEISGADGFIPFHASYFWVPNSKYILIPKDKSLIFSIGECPVNREDHHICDLIIGSLKNQESYGQSLTQLTPFRKTGVYIQKKNCKVNTSKQEFLLTIILFTRDSLGHIVRKENVLPVLFITDKKNIDSDISKVFSKKEVLYRVGNPGIIYQILI
jgi:hypothetical protein